MELILELEEIIVWLLHFSNVETKATDVVTSIVLLELGLPDLANESLTIFGYTYTKKVFVSEIQI